VKYLIPVILGAGIIILFLALLITNNPVISEQDAISLIKNQYPELQDFPSDGLPPKVIRTEYSSEGWYVMFETQGSGRPIIEAKCFFVDNLKKITLTGHYKPETNDKIIISAKTCN
jgi:hypothetical protein